jgi:hypothetical protein
MNVQTNQREIIMRREVAFWSCAALLIFGSMALAEEQRPYVGMNLDSAPLPELLTKHLRLDPGQGIRINNIMVGSPADKAGLERDDIVVALEGQKVTKQEQFIADLRKAGIGTKIALEVIHLGEHKTVQPKLGPAPESVQWKYPPEPDVVTSWRPGKFYKIGPGGKDLMEIPLDQIPDINIDMKNFFKQSYTYNHTTGGENYTITIEGDPADKDSRLIVHAGDKDYSATVGDLATLPEKYREPAQQAVEDARTSVKLDIRVQGLQMPDILGPDARRKFLPNMDRLSEQKDLALEKLQSQIERLQQRMKEMEEHNHEMIEKLLPKKETKENQRSESQQTPEPSAATQKQPI